MSTTTPNPPPSPASNRHVGGSIPRARGSSSAPGASGGLVTVKGRFEHYEGRLDLRREPALELTIDASSLDTNNGKRDQHLRAAAFFDVDKHPQVRFVSDRATMNGERLTVSGQLYAAGTSIPLNLDARLRRVGEGLEVDARTSADHRHLGMIHSPLGMIRPPT